MCRSECLCSFVALCLPVAAESLTRPIAFASCSQRVGYDTLRQVETQEAGLLETGCTVLSGLWLYALQCDHLHGSASCNALMQRLLMELHGCTGGMQLARLRKSISRYITELGQLAVQLSDAQAVQQMLPQLLLGP